MTRTRTIGVVGTGVIGAGWAVRALARGHDVVAWDPAPGAADRLRAAVARAWPSAARLGLFPGADPSRITWVDTAEELASRVDWIQENAPENEDVKRPLMCTLAAHSGRLTWHDSFDDVPEGFLLLVANELFDAIPIRQFVKTPQGFRERVVSLDSNDDLVFSTGLASIDPALLPPQPERQPLGAIFEISPAREAVMTAICQRLSAHGGTALAIDYGHLVAGYGDTLQAMRNHAFDPALAHPGEADLTSHVDFESLVKTAEATGVHVNGTLRQGDFLYGLGLGGMNRMPLLPEKFRGAQKEPGPQLPTNHVGPLVDQDRQIPIGLNPLGIGLTDDRLTGRPDDQGLLQLARRP